MSTTGSPVASAAYADRVAPGVKIAAQISPEPREQDLAFIRQMGVEHVVLWTDSSKSSAEYYAERKAFFAAHGLDVYGFGNRDVHNQDAIVLGLEGRDAKVDEYVRHIRALGKAGIPYTTYAHMPNGIWSTEREETRGGASARGFDEAKATSGRWHDRTYDLPLTNGREYSEEEVWGHFEYFIKRAACAAEEEGVFIGIHPDDPPIARLGGVPRIFSTFDGYKRALAIADSPNVGICLCVGCWLEGGELWGVGAIEAIRHFAAENKLFKVHFRNVDAPLPHFVETFIDDGYQDMYQIMKTLQEVGFRGVAIPDHIPQMADDPRLGTAYTIGYMRALLRRAQEEVGR
ncbi:MAG: Mannonate dehydratase [uncultured Thermomicrobiales bacterium]|uniref:mannonate dehydratase n=1 Tax=uncultured Thermomicrobiales bacterium TaxID=1645740 RepID=A0A6J4VUJ3_9BACT|nr:MAG: Mannonate dehydratase [uncultured Thermomicrobiales bacterium]